MVKRKEQYNVSGTTRVKGNEISRQKQHEDFFFGFFFSTARLFTSLFSGIFGVFGLFPLLCTAKWLGVRQRNKTSHRSNLKFEFKCFFSVSIVCMVNPDADNLTTSISTDENVDFRNIPASCQKHAVETHRTVK